MEVCVILSWFRSSLPLRGQENASKCCIPFLNECLYVMVRHFCKHNNFILHKEKSSCANVLHHMPQQGCNLTYTVPYRLKDSASWTSFGSTTCTETVQNNFDRFDGTSIVSIWLHGPCTGTGSGAGILCQCIYTCYNAWFHHSNLITDCWDNLVDQWSKKHTV